MQKTSPADHKVVHLINRCTHIVSVLDYKGFKTRKKSFKAGGKAEVQLT